MVAKHPEPEADEGDKGEVPLYRTPSYWALFDAIGQGDEEAVETILANKTDPMELLRKKDLQGLTPLKKAVALSKASITKTLVSYGAEPSIKDPLGKTVLHTAVTQGSQFLMAPLLVSADSNVNVQDKFGWTPLHYAVRGKHNQAAHWLMFLGADASIANKDGKIPADMCAADSPLLPYLRRLGHRNPVEETIELSSTFVPKKQLSKLGSDGNVMMVTSDNWPYDPQFLLNVRIRAIYALPPIPLRQDEVFFEDGNKYRTMYQLPVGKTRVKVYFSVFEEFLVSELIMKVTSKQKFLGEVPVSMSTYPKHGYTNYLACAELDVKNQGQFVLVKRPRHYLLYRDDDGVLSHKEHPTFKIHCPEGSLPSWPSTWEDERYQRSLDESEALMEPLLKKFAAKMRDPCEDEEEKPEGDGDGEEKDKTENKNMEDSRNNNRREEQPDRKSIEEGEEEEDEEEAAVLLDGQEPDECEDFYYISRGWGLYLQVRHSLDPLMLLQINLPDSVEENVLRCATPFYHLHHSSKENPYHTCTVQIPKTPEFQKIGTVLVFARDNLYPTEDEYPDPDDLVEETYVAEDGKSSKLEWWLTKERDHWHLLPNGIVNKQTRVVFETDIFTTFIAVQLTQGLDKWETEYGDDSDESGSDSDDDDEGGEGGDEGEGGEGGEGEGGGGEDGDGDKKKKKKKKKKNEDGGGAEEGNKEGDDGGKKAKFAEDEEKGKNQNSNVTEKNQNASVAETDENVNKARDEPHQEPDLEPPLEPGPPAPSPQASLSNVKTKSSEEDLRNGQVAGNTNCNHSSNASNNNNKNQNNTMDVSHATSGGNLAEEDLSDQEAESETTLNLLPEERTLFMGLSPVRLSYASLTRRPTVPAEGDEPQEIESDEELPTERPRAYSIATLQNGQTVLEQYTYGPPLSSLEFGEETNMEVLQSQIALMWRYRNHSPVVVVTFVKQRPSGEQVFDIVIEMVKERELIVRAESWLSKGYKMVSKSDTFPTKTNRVFEFNISGLVIVDDPAGAIPPGGTKQVFLYYCSCRVNFFEFVVRRPPEEKGLGGGKKKKNPKAEVKPDLTVDIEGFHIGSRMSSKEVTKFKVLLTDPDLWYEHHQAFRIPLDAVLLDKVVDSLCEIPEVCDVWWKMWIFLGYTDGEMEAEKIKQDWASSLAILLNKWFADNLDRKDRGIIRLLDVLDLLGLKEPLDEVVLLMKKYKSELMQKKTKPRYLEIFFHWTLGTKMTSRNLLSLIDPVIMVPVSDIYLLQLSNLLPTDATFDLGAAMEVEDNILHAIEGEDVLVDPTYKPFKVLLKSRQKNDDIVKYVLLLMDMVKTLELQEAHDFVVRETRKWMETIAAKNKEICHKLEVVLSS